MNEEDLCSLQLYITQISEILESEREERAYKIDHQKPMKVFFVQGQKLVFTFHAICPKCKVETDGGDPKYHIEIDDCETSQVVFAYCYECDYEYRVEYFLDVSKLLGAIRLRYAGVPDEEI